MDTIRIGTRVSKLAIKQAQIIQEQMETFGHSTQTVPVKSEGDVELKKPLYSMGIVGIFTKALDMALLEKKIDLAVHSLKDVPTILPEGIQYGAFLTRDSHQDILVYKGNGHFLKNRNSTAVIATSSLRRKAAWLNRFPHHKIENMRGNIHSRLKKLQESNYDGSIFAKAGLERINLLKELPHMGLNYCLLDWMIPAPAQGIIAVTCLSNREDIINKIRPINSRTSEIEATVERDFLSTLEGGCTAPIAANATLTGDTITLKTGLYSLDGRECKKQIIRCKTDDYQVFGKQAGMDCLKTGGESIMQDIRSVFK